MYGFEILGYVFPDKSVPSGGAPYKSSIFIQERNRQAIKFHLAKIIDLILRPAFALLRRGKQKFFNSLFPIPELFFAKNIIQGKHPGPVFYLYKFIKRFPRHSVFFCVNIRVFGIFLQQFLELPSQRSEERRVGKECRSRWS